MQLTSATPYKKWLPRQLKNKGWSYEVLARLTKKKKQNLNATVTGVRPVPKNKFIEELARLFDVSPYTVLEYKKRKAIEKLNEFPELIDLVLKASPSDEKKEVMQIEGKPLTEEEEYEYRLAGEEAVRRFRRARGQPGAGESTAKRNGRQGKSKSA